MMLKAKVTFTGVLLMLSLGVVMLGCDDGDDPQDLLEVVLEANKLVVSMDPAYPPQSERDDDGNWEGFDVAVAEEVAQRLGVELEFTDPDWEYVTGGNWEGRWDLSVGSMTATAPRAENLFFTNAYYFTPASYAIHTDNTTLTSTDDLAGATIGVGAETTYLDYLWGTLEIMEGVGGGISYEAPADVDPREYTVESEVIAALVEGDGVNVDAIMAAQPTIQAAIDGGDPIEFIGTPAFYEPLVFALDRSRPGVSSSDAMVARLNEIVAEMHSDGTLTSLSTTWYGFDITQQQ